MDESSDKPLWREIATHPAFIIVEVAVVILTVIGLVIDLPTSILIGLGGAAVALIAATIAASVFVVGNDSAKSIGDRLRDYPALTAGSPRPGIQRQDSAPQREAQHIEPQRQPIDIQQIIREIEQTHERARQGVLLLNAVLTVRQALPNSHKGRGWERFTDAIIRKLNEKETPVVFVLWGQYAQKKISLIDTTRHKIVKCAHPSPFSSHLFFGCRPFSQVNAALRDAGKPEINWQIANV